MPRTKRRAVKALVPPPPKKSKPSSSTSTPTTKPSRPLPTRGSSATKPITTTSRPPPTTRASNPPRSASKPPSSPTPTPPSPQQPAATPPPPDFDTTLFSNVGASLKWPEYQRLQLVSGRNIELGSQHDYKLRTPLLDAGWGGMLSVPTDVYPRLVRLFYCNLELISTESDNLSLKSFVKGVHVDLTLFDIARIFDISMLGYNTYVKSDCDLAKLVPSVTKFLHTITKDSTMLGGMRHDHLKPHLLLLNKFLISNVLPRGGHVDKVLPMQSYLLFCLTTLKPICLPFIILTEMESVVRKGRSLPYAAKLTSIFEEFGVDFTGEEPITPTLPLNARTLKRMLTMNEESDLDEDAEVQNDIQDGAPPMCSGCAKVRTKLQTIQHQLTSLSTNMSSMLSHFGVKHS